MSVIELTIWVDPILASWISSQASKEGCLRHRYIEKALAQLMEDQLSKSQEEEPRGGA
jgi:hypothetical protein